MNVAIIGSGPAGLMTALAIKNADVTVYETNKESGKKLLLTGSGRCNYWNKKITIDKYHTSNKDVLEKIITIDNQKQAFDILTSIGIVPKIKGDLYYPMSNNSISVRNALVLECKIKGVNFVYDKKITKIEKKDKFIIDGREYDKVVLATGSKAYPKTGSGMGYNIASDLGLSITDVKPALVPLITIPLKNIVGIRSEVEIRAYENNKLVYGEVGEIQFTDYGLSGICILNASNYINNGYIEINFLPFCNSLEEAASYLEDYSTTCPGICIKDLLDNLINYKLVNILTDDTSLKYYSELSKKEKYKLAKSLYQYKIEIKGRLSFDRSQVCMGGVSLDCVDPNTLESNIKDLYVVGELLDVAGDCGGYNLAFAFISGMIAGRSI